MSVLSYVPFTQSRRERLMQMSWHSYVGDHDGLALVEWPDGSKSPKPVDWDDELNALVSPDGKRWFVRGRAAEPRQMFGVPVWDVNAEGLGVVSTEASLLADREHFDEYIETTAQEVQAQGGPENVLDPGDVEAVADGGTSAAGTLYNLNPPRGYDGEAFSVGLPADYAPHPASQTDAEQAVTQAMQAQNDGGQNLKWLLIGAGMVLASILIFFILQWLLAELSGSSGGGGGGTISALLPMLAFGTSTLRDRAGRLAGRVTGVTG